MFVFHDPAPAQLTDQEILDFAAETRSLVSRVSPGAPPKPMDTIIRKLLQHAKLEVMQNNPMSDDILVKRNSFGRGILWERSSDTPLQRRLSRVNGCAHALLHNTHLQRIIIFRECPKDKPEVKAAYRQAAIFGIGFLMPLEELAPLVEQDLPPGIIASRLLADPYSVTAAMKFYGLEYPKHSFNQQAFNEAMGL